MLNQFQKYSVIDEYGPLPAEVIDRYGLRVSTNTDVWRLNTAGRMNDTIYLNRIKHPVFKYAFSRYLIFSIERLSPNTVFNRAYHIFAQLECVGFFEGSETITEMEVLEASLRESVNQVLQNLRLQNKLFDFYNLARFYSWCSDKLPGCGFCPDFALQLSRIKIPGNIKGEAVRSEDPETGPLHFELEEPLVRAAIVSDQSEKFEHRQQRLAVALCLVFGRNPLNYARLREEDFCNLTQNFPASEDLWQLNIPRIKKRSNPRELFRTETCNKQLAIMIQDMIDRNKQFSTDIGGVQMPRPLLMRKVALAKLIGSDSQDYAFAIRTSEITDMVSKWAKRMGLLSPVTNDLLHLTPRRLRYTFACNMIRQGASRAALAEMLDHTDTQHVGVYYELFDELVGMLDKALALKVGKLTQWFQGSIVESNKQAVNGDVPDKHLSFIGMENPAEQIEIGVCGEAQLCHLDPPYSCYLCPKFQPYRHANHQRVLEIMLSDREERLKRYENSRLGIQLDDVIYAVANVTELCKV